MRNAPESRSVEVIPVHGMPEITPGTALLDEVLRACRRQRTPLRAGDILVLTHKVVSKAEGRLQDLETTRPSRRARSWAARYPVDARVIELALREAGRIVRMEQGVLITQTGDGLVCANSGVDLSNVDGGKTAALLPRDPDASAARIRRQLRRLTGLYVPVIITDTFGRPWREGLTEVAIGLAGMKAMRDLRRQRDPHGYTLRVSLEAVADALAAIAGAACGKLSRCPACIIRGFAYERGRGRASDLVRPPERDLFR